MLLSSSTGDLSRLVTPFCITYSMGMHCKGADEHKTVAPRFNASGLRSAVRAFNPTRACMQTSALHSIITVPQYAGATKEEKEDADTQYSTRHSQPMFPRCAIRPMPHPAATNCHSLACAITPNLLHAASCHLPRSHKGHDVDTSPPPSSSHERLEVLPARLAAGDDVGDGTPASENRDGVGH